MSTWIEQSPHRTMRADGLCLQLTHDSYLIMHRERSLTEHEVLALHALIDVQPDASAVTAAYADATRQMPEGARYGLQGSRSTLKAEPTLAEISAFIDRALPQAEG
mgnify:CR=1 FL=1